VALDAKKEARKKQNKRRQARKEHLALEASLQHLIQKDNRRQSDS
jgi:hypothetical protein